MYLIESKRDGEWIYDPGIVMALQEYVKDHIFLDEDIMFTYMTYPTVQIGKFQNAYEEINLDYMNEHNIRLVRRETGGGAIYLDNYNMNFCFLFDGSSNLYGNYAQLYKPAIDALKILGVKSLEQRGRNDLVLDGKKIAGAAMTLQQNRVYAGYSLLLDPDYEAMSIVLNPNQKKIKAHGIQSVRSRVGAIRDYLAPQYKDMTVWAFKNYIICQLLHIRDVNDAKHYELTAKEWKAVEEIASEKYNNWDWNYGRFKYFEYELTGRFSIGTIHVGLKIEHAKIAAIQLTGDFFGTKNIQDVENALVGVRLRKTDIIDALEVFDLRSYFGDITKDDFAHFLLNGQT